MTENKVVKHEQSPAILIEQAVQGGADLEKLEKLLKLQERWEAINAKKEYVKAMTAFKANPPKIEKDKKVAYKEVKYYHATLANVTEKINKGLSEHGLSASWTTKQNGIIEVTCRIMHELGHSEETTLSAPADVTGSKNAIQAIGSTISYLQRYTLLSLTGLATEDMDNDARMALEVISETQVKTLDNILKNFKEERKEKFLAYMKVTKVEEINEKDFKKALMAINEARDKK